MKRLALVGAGMMGARYLDAFSEDPNGTVVAICELDLEKGRAVSEKHLIKRLYTSVDQLLNDGEVDALIVATPDFAHASPVLAALAAGLDVLCEKPLATSIEDAVEMVRASDASSGQLMVNFGNRHRPAAKRARALIEEDRIGAPRHAWLCLNEKASKTATLTWSAQTSALWFLISHLTDLAHWLINDRVVRAYAVNGQDTGGAVTTTAVLTYASGATAVLESTWDLPDSYQRDVDLRVSVHGSRGVLDLDMGDQGLIVSGPDRTATVQWDSQLGSSSDDWWNRSCRHFTASISAGDLVQPNGRAGLANVLALSALQRSLDTGKAVDVEQEWPVAAALVR